MSQRSRYRFEFQPALPLEGVDPGTNLLVSGPSPCDVRDVALGLIVCGNRKTEGTVLVAADLDAESLFDRCQRLDPDLDPTQLGIVDCAEAEESNRFESYYEAISDPGELHRIGMELSRLHEALATRDPGRIRIGLFSVETFFDYAPYRDVSRFVHMLTGRVIATGDLGVFPVDTTAVDTRKVEVIENFCDATVQVRTVDDTAHLRVEGLDGQPDSWTPIPADEREQ